MEVTQTRKLLSSISILEDRYFSVVCDSCNCKSEKGHMKACIKVHAANDLVGFSLNAMNYDYLQLHIKRPTDHQ